MRLSELLEHKDLPRDPEIRGLGYQSRKVQRGDLFIALVGRHHDGHRFLEDARRRGAVAALVEHPVPEVDLLQVRVPNTRTAMARVAARFYGHPSRTLSVFGITGTNGKTTTAYLLKTFLDLAGVPTGLLGTIEYDLLDRRLLASLTTPESPDLQRYLREILDAGGRAAVMEVSSHSVAEHRIDEVHFRYGIFTNLGRDHLDYHGSVEQYMEAKLRFLERVAEVLVVNADDPRAPRVIQRARATRVLTFGRQPEADLRFRILRNDLYGLDLELAGVFSGRFSLPLPGAYNAYNLLGALLAFHAFTGENPLAYQQTFLKRFQGVPGRFQTLLGRGAPFQVIVDYAHTPDALEVLLRAVRDLKPRRIIVVFGAGGDRDIGKRPLMARTVEQWADVLVLTSDNPRSEDPLAIIADLLQGLQNPDEGVYVQPDRRQAIALALDLAQEGDVVVLAGKGHEVTQTIQGQKIPFDDRKVARELLKERGLLP